MVASDRSGVFDAPRCKPEDGARRVNGVPEFYEWRRGVSKIFARKQGSRASRLTSGRGAKPGSSPLQAPLKLLARRDARARGKKSKDTGQSPGFYCLGATARDG